MRLALATAAVTSVAAVSVPQHHTSTYTRAKAAICHYFTWNCDKAMRVAWCESRYNVFARNGQYWGMFQMGSNERARYGHSWDMWGQARAAHAYWADAGWGRWSCG